MNKKPPIGLRPMYICDNLFTLERRKEIIEAIERYKKVNKEIPLSWWMELKILNLTYGLGKVLNFNKKD
jgi:hypothetical protein